MNANKVIVHVTAGMQICSGRFFQHLEVFIFKCKTEVRVKTQQEVMHEIQQLVSPPYKNCFSFKHENIKREINIWLVLNFRLAFGWLIGSMTSPGKSLTSQQVSYKTHRLFFLLLLKRGCFLFLSPQDVSSGARHRWWKKSHCRASKQGTVWAHGWPKNLI